ncbi:DNA primase [Lysobacter sp. GX 14042]|uniref:DNA primase n=1 Tax=Lysobacter sp. GX 14042 TaxID=2907155 RepID=UPI001F35AE59|nr:DNA primase [Lysobacter sp. GX 14042]MCE7033432.1 DNA primase [Lysobacter sp. GX 14042]
MARIPDAFIDDLLARTDIVELIGSRVQLKKQGREYSARCPFHDERSPSFTVSPTKQFYHCFGCGAHGTAISFLMNYDRLEFLDAIEELARRAGMEIPREAGQRHSNPDGQALYDTLAAAAEFFQRQLPGSGKARDYLRQRGLEPATCERFGVGYAPDSFDALRTTLGSDERRMKLLERAGLLSRSESGRVYDKFRDRLLFPIHDRRGRPIAFGGRVLEKDAAPKYLNSPETELFHKGRELYGLWQVRQAHSTIPRLVVVEGYMDVVMLFQHGVDTAVATLGTATTGEHAELLFRNAPDVYFCFDGDRAGRSAAWKALESVLPRMRDGRQALFLFLPEGEDPDSIVRSEGAAGFNERLRSATPLSDFLFDTLSAEVDLGTLEGRGRLAGRARPLLAQIPDGAFADLMRQRLDGLTGLDSAGPAQPRPTPRQAPARGTPAPRRSLVRSVIVLLLQQPSLALELEPPFRFASLHQPGIDLLVDLLGLVYERPDIRTGALIEHFAGQEIHASLQSLATIDLPGEPASWRTEFLDAIARLDHMTSQQRVDELQAAIRAGGMSALDAAQKEELRELQGRLQR